MARKYSPSTRGFYDEFSSDIPEDATNVSDALYLDLMGAQSQGKIIQPGEDGTPIAVDSPPMTPGRAAEINGWQRDALLSVAALRIAPLQDAVDLGSATAAETASLTAWKQYRVALNRLDLTVATVTWPAAPT